MENPSNPNAAPPKLRPKASKSSGIEPGRLTGRRSSQVSAIDPDAELLAEVAKMDAAQFKQSRFMKGPDAKENFDRYREALARKGQQ